jgi:hypothetical protein
VPRGARTVRAGDMGPPEMLDEPLNYTTGGGEGRMIDR